VTAARAILIPMGWKQEIAVERDNASELALFEGRRAYMRVGAGFAVLLVIPGLPLAVLYTTAYLAHSRALQVALGLVLFVAGAASGSIWRRRLWAWPVSSRLQRWYAFDPSRGEVAVNVNEADGPAAYRALKRAQLLPKYHRCELGILPPPGVGPRPGLRTPSEWRIGVVRPLLAPPVAYEDLARRTRDALARAGIGARVGGVDVLGGPRGRASHSPGCSPARQPLAPTAAAARPPGRALRRSA